MTSPSDRIAQLAALPPEGNLRGPDVAVLAHGERGAIRIGGALAMLDLGMVRELRAALAALEDRITAAAGAGWVAPADAPRSRAGDLLHVCNGDNRSGLAWGRLAEPGACPRCDERRYTGAPARDRGGANRHP